MQHNELNHINLEGMIEKAIYKKTAVALQFLSTVTSRGFQKFFRSSDNCCALFERSEFAKAVIHRRTKEFRKRKWVTVTQSCSAPASYFYLTLSSYPQVKNQ